MPTGVNLILPTKKERQVIKSYQVETRTGGQQEYKVIFAEIGIRKDNFSIKKYNLKHLLKSYKFY